MDQSKPPFPPGAGMTPAGADDLPDEDQQDERLEELPEFERDPDTSVGGGVMETGGTVVERGTDTLGGTAQGPNAGEDTYQPTDRRVDDNPIDGRPDLGPEYASRQPLASVDQDDDGGPMSGDPERNEPDDTVPNPQTHA